MEHRGESAHPRRGTTRGALSQRGLPESRPRRASRVHSIARPLPKQVIRSIQIQDDPTRQEDSGVEVVITFDAGERRWCFFITPSSLESVGDLVDGFPARYHTGVSHMIVVSMMSAPVIESVLHELDARGEIESCTCGPSPEDQAP